MHIRLRAIGFAALLVLVSASAHGQEHRHAARMLGDMMAAGLGGVAVPCPVGTAENLGGDASDYACIQVAAAAHTVEQLVAARFEPHGVWTRPWAEAVGGRVVSRPYVAQPGHSFVFSVGAVSPRSTVLFIRIVEIIQVDATAP